MAKRRTEHDEPRVGDALRRECAGLAVHPPPVTDRAPRHPLGGTRVALALALLVSAGCGTDPEADAGPDSSSALDAAAVDAGLADASMTDAGVTDAGVTDADVTDAGETDAGVTDAGVTDVGGLTGRVRYEDRPYGPPGFTGALVPTPARGVLVEVLDGPTTVASARTDDEGRFAFAGLPLAVGAVVTVRASSDATFGAHRVQVTDRARRASIYAIEASATVGAGDVELLAEHATGLGGPFNIVDTAHRAFELIAPFVTTTAPTLVYRWERGRAFACGSCYSRDVISLGGQVADTDEYDDDIILHELGHYFVDHFSRDTSPGGTHRDRQVSPQLAYGEGVAYFFACMVQGSPVIVDTFDTATRVIDIEEMTQGGVAQPDFMGTTGGANGDLREEIVAGVMWDAFDAARTAEGFDRVELGVAGQMSLLVSYFGTWPHPDQGASGIDLADYLHALECVAGVPAADVQALADDRGFPYVAGGGC